LSPQRVHGGAVQRHGHETRERGTSCPGSERNVEHGLNALRVFEEVQRFRRTLSRTPIEQATFRLNTPLNSARPSACRTDGRQRRRRPVRAALYSRGEGLKEKWPPSGEPKCRVFFLVQTPARNSPSKGSGARRPCSHESAASDRRPDLFASFTGYRVSCPVRRRILEENATGGLVGGSSR
jgi:hypothetical protein